MTREEAIKLVKRIIGAMVYTEEEKEAIETLIPELRESVDERVREEIKEFILKQADRGDLIAKRKKWIAYLEKQKDKERLDRMAPIYNDKESFESALEKAWKYYNESASRKVDSFEDNYIECVFSKGFREGFLYKEKQKERGPLTKDEEYTLHRIIEYLEDETCPSEWISLLHDIYCLPYAKQEEQKPVEVKPRFKIGDTLKKKNKDYTFVVDKIQGGFYLTSNKHFFPIEEQDSWELLEQKPVNNYLEWRNIVYYVLKEWLGIGQYMDMAPFNDIVKTLQERYSLPKPVEWNKATINGEPIPTENHSVNIPLAEWSEEDSDMICEIIDHCITIPYIGGTLRLSDERKKELKTFVKSLRPVKQEWSEEDEKMIDHLIEALPMWATGRIAMLPSQAEEYVKRLKALRPRPQPHTVSVENATKFGNLEYERGVKDGLNHRWKPSDEQIEALEWMLTTVTIKDGGKGVVLQNLVKDLKKQM